MFSYVVDYSANLMSNSANNYKSKIQLSILYLLLLVRKIMYTNTIQKESTWNKMVHAPFKKVIMFDLICMGIGVVMGMGIGAYLVS